MKIAVTLVAVAGLTSGVLGVWTATQSPSQTVLPAGPETFETGTWSAAGISQVFSIVEINTVQTRVPAAYGDWWPEDSDLEVTTSTAPGALFNIVGFEFDGELSAINLALYSTNGIFNGFGGGVNVDLFLDETFVGATVVERPAWSTNLFPEWVTIESDSGQTFDQIRFYTPSAIASRAPRIDDVSWASVESCPCETDGASGQVDVADLLVYLSLWFPADPSADLDGMNGTDVADLLAFLACWFPAASGAPCS